MRKVITVDGLAGSGKSTLAKLLSQKLGSVHFNSGLLYRAVGLLALQEGVDVTNAKKAAALLDQHVIELRGDAKRGTQLMVDGKDMTEFVKTVEISTATSITSAHYEVRQRLVSLQREIFPEHNMVAEGRDMGTVIFPESELKFYVVADLQVRVTRRLAMLFGELGEIPVSERNLLKVKVESELVERDRRDSGREVAPLKPAHDAIMIDNSSRSLTEIVQSMYDAALRRGLC